VTYKSIALDLERPIRVARVGDGRGSGAAQGAREHLQIGLALVLLPWKNSSHAELALTDSHVVDIGGSEGGNDPRREGKQGREKHYEVFLNC